MYISWWFLTTIWWPMMANGIPFMGCLFPGCTLGPRSWKIEPFCGNSMDIPQYWSLPPYSFGRTAPNETMMDVDEITSGPQNGAVLFFWGGWVLNWKNRRRVQRFQIWAFNGSWFSLDPSPRSETRELPGEHVMTFTVGFAFRGEHEINLQPQIMYRSTHFRRLQYNIRFCQGSLTN